MNEEIIPDFAIADRGPASKACLVSNLMRFHDVAIHVRALPYGRTSDPTQLLLVLEEARGTCSSKHAFLAEVARENEQPIQLAMGMYLMNEANTPGVGSVLDSTEIDSIPEAHCYLVANDSRFDFTRPDNPVTPNLRFLAEEKIQPYQAGAFKTERHRSFLREWIHSEGIGMDFDTVWAIRERCIANLS